MRVARPLIILVACAVALALPGVAGAQSAQPRIIAGNAVDSSAHPYQVRLNIRFGSSSYQCGGVIRDATHVMTAAHCVVNSGSVAAPGNVTVYYGSADRSAQVPAAVYSVLAAPEYVAGDGSYDAALLTLTAPLGGYGTPSVQPIGLASSAALASAVAAGASSLVSGWGLTERGSVSQNLMDTTLSLRPDSVCRNVYGSTYVSARFVCAGGTGASGSSNNPDSCSGDSGGPLVIPTGSGHLLVGLVSFGPTGGCGRGGLPGAYTEVSNPSIFTLLTGRTAEAPASAPAPSPVTPAPVGARPDRTPPWAGVTGLRCRKRRCAVTVAARDNQGAVPSILALASRRVRVCITRRSGRKSCRRALRTRKLALRRVSGGFRGRFELTPGSYRFSAVVTDVAGNRSRTATLAFRVRR